MILGMDNSNYNIETLIPREELELIIERLASEISHDYKDQEIVLIGVLNGAYVFLHDLSRALLAHGMERLIIDFVGIDTYGDKTESSEEPKITKDLKMNIRGKTVILVEDIVDTGLSLKTLQALLTARQPKSLVTVALLSKAARRKIEVPVEYIGKQIPDKFVVGYGLDYDGKYHRELPYIGVVKFN